MKCAASALPLRRSGVPDGNCAESFVAPAIAVSRADYCPAGAEPALPIRGGFRAPFSAAGKARYCLAVFYHCARLFWLAHKTLGAVANVTEGVPAFRTKPALAPAGLCVIGGALWVPHPTHINENLSAQSLRPNALISRIYSESRTELTIKNEDGFYAILSACRKTYA